MKEETLKFDQVFIHSESDLPKEKGEYVTYIESHKLIYRAYKYDPKNKVDRELWKNLVTWYFRPISPVPVTKERIIEILKSHISPQDLDRNRYNLLHGVEAFENIADDLLSLSPERKMTEWISVNDRLPEKSDADENGKVLIYREANPDQKGLSKSVYDFYMVKYCDKSTFWMPLPKSPESQPSTKE